MNERTRELGIRMALGADGPRVRRMVLLDGMKLCALGLVIGVAGALAGTRLLEHLVFGSAPNELPSYLAAGGLLAAVALLACWISARRATRVDPMVALRVS